ncbi:MAG TPA: hypothetical protein VFY13_07565 [Luteolibacter sp.]|nr:hypothetical protein [Luteolibacter sp.]
MTDPMKKTPQTRPTAQPGSKWSLRVMGACVLLAAGFALYLQVRDQDHPTGQPATPQSGKPVAQQPQEHAALPAHEKPASAPATNATRLTEKEQMICDIINSGRSMDQMAAYLLALLPQCEGPEQTLAASHLADLINPEQADQLVPLLGNPKIAAEVKERFFTKMFEREPMEVAALMIQVIEQGNTKFAAEAQKTLGILLTADHGTDVAAWRAELQAQKMRQAAE